MKDHGKKMAAAMKKKGVGIFAPKALSDSLAAICGGKKMPRSELRCGRVEIRFKYHVNNGLTN